MPSGQAYNGSAPVQIGLQLRLGEYRLIRCQQVIPALSCLVLLLSAAQAQDEKNPPSSSKGQLLSPVVIDDKYLSNDIQAKSPQGTLTLRGAVADAAVHNKDVLKANLEVSRFKWDYLAAETSRL